jgi:O-antigen/teichoic acid export membrane protein
LSKIINFLSKKDIRSAAAGSVVIKFGSAFFAFLNSVLLARYLGVQGFGYYVLAFSTMTILSVMATMGIPNLITRYISKYDVHNNFSAVKGLLIKTNLFVVFSTVIIFALAFISYLFWWRHYNSVLVETLLYSFLLVPLLGFGALLSAALRGLKLVILSELPNTIFRNFLFSISIVICVIIDYKLTPQLAIIFQIFAAALGFLLGYIFLRKNLLLKLKTISPTYFNKEWVSQTIPFSISSGVQVVKSKALTFILAVFGSIESVAIFEVAMRGAALVSFILDGLNMAISPFISSSFEKGETANIQKILKKTSRIILAFSLPVALLFIIGGEQLIQFVFGDDYKGSYIPLVILCVGQLFSAIIGSVGLVLNMTGNQKVYSNNNIMMLLLIILLSIPIVIYYNVNGAAVLFSATLVLQNILLLVYVKNNLKINTTVF